MTEATETPQWIDLSQCDDPRDVIHQAVACLARGGVLGLATECSYVLAAGALPGHGLERLRALSEQPLTMAIKSVEEVADWVPSMPEAGWRLAWRLWPGPVTLTLPVDPGNGLLSRLPENVRERMVSNGGLTLLCTSHPVMQGLLELMPAPLILGMAGSPEDSRAVTAEPLRRLGGLDMVIDSGRTRFEKGFTQVKIEADRWSLDYEGAVSGQVVKRMSGRIILFICTGNTCRSPMAEAICRLLLAKKLNCEPGQLEDRGYSILSAGVATAGGSPAAHHAMEVLREMGGSLDSHRSRPTTIDLIRTADWIFAMTSDHRDALLDMIPEAASHTYLLDPYDEDVPDPIGSEQAVYRQTARKLEQMIQARLDQIAP